MSTPGLDHDGRPHLHTGVADDDSDVDHDAPAVCVTCSANGLGAHRCAEPDSCPCASTELHDAGVVPGRDPDEEARPDVRE